MSVVFVTGGTGFVGRRLVALLEQAGDRCVVPGPDVDITDATAVIANIVEAQPDVIYHLAGQANVAASWTAVDSTFAVNFDGTRHVLAAALGVRPLPRVVIVSSADVYGPSAFANGPVDETAPTLPVSPYGASKLAAEIVARQHFDAHGLPVFITRAFNHIGPGQSDGFIVGAVSRQIAEAERSGHTTIEVGDTTAVRDFLDVDDVVRAYQAIATSGMPGTTYNVASGVGVSIREVIDTLIAESSASLSTAVDPQRLRPVAQPVMIGDATKLRQHTGWSPQSSWREAARAALADWRSRVS